jgi:hypothetical protein
LALGSAPASATTAWAQQGLKLSGSGEIGNGGFGGSVSFSADGNTALVGASSDNSNAGAAWVFTRSGGVWTQQAELTGGVSEVGNAFFGYSVSLSADGNTAVIGGYGDNNFIGAAWVFTRSGAVWGQQGPKLIGDATEVGGCIGLTCDHRGSFGSSVAISPDGSTALIGSTGDNGGDGAAWVFRVSGGVWTQMGSKLIPSDEIGGGGFGGFAHGVALSSDGNTALIGGKNDNGNVGAAWVFTNSGSGWTQQGSKLTGAGEIAASYGGIFGQSVAVSSDGNTAMIGGSGDNNWVGAAWVFTRSGGAWAQQGSKLTSYSTGEVGSGRFGTDVALSSDGSTSLIGGSTDGVSGQTGAAWVYTRTGAVWAQEGSKLTASDEVGGGNFGTGVALSSDGANALIGGSGDNGAGAAWAFSALAAPTTTINTQPSNPSSSNSAVFTFSADETATFQCKLDSGSYAGCTSGISYGSLTDGSHTFSVQATNNGTGTGAAASYSWTVAISAPTPPDVSIATHPTDPSASGNATFGFSSTDGGATFLCSLDTAAYVVCANPDALSGLSPGRHTFAIESADSRTGLTSAPVGFAWTVQNTTTTPTVTLLSHPHASSAESGAAFTFTSNDTTATFLCSLDLGVFATCTSPESYNRLARGSHSFAVEATNKGQTSLPTSYSWKITAPALTASPRLIGILRQGHTLYASAGRWRGAAISYYFAWYRCNAPDHSCQRITVTHQMPNSKRTTRPLATRSHALTAADRGKRLYVVVTATNANGSNTARTPLSAKIRY